MSSRLAEARAELDAFCKKYNITTPTHNLITKSITIEILNNESNEDVDDNLPKEYAQLFITKIARRTGVLGDNVYRYNYTYYTPHYMRDLEERLPQLKTCSSYFIQVVTHDRERLLFIYIPDNQHTSIQHQHYKQIAKDIGLNSLFKVLRSEGTVVPVDYKQYPATKINSVNKLVVGISAHGTLDISYLSVDSRSKSIVK